MSIPLLASLALFKELLDTKIATSSHPTLSFNKVSDLFAHLKSAGYEFPEKLQAMLLLAKLPHLMDVVTQMIVQAKDASGKQKTPTVEEICEAAVLSWDQHHMKEAPKAAQANKISTVKRKGNDPNSSSSRHRKVTARRRSGSTVNALAKSKRKKSQGAPPPMPMPTSLQSPIPPVLSRLWIPTPSHIALPRCNKVNKVLPSIQGLRALLLSPIGLSSQSPVKMSVGSILGFRSKGLVFYLPPSASCHQHTHPQLVLHPCRSHLHTTPLLSSTI